MKRTNLFLLAMVLSASFLFAQNDQWPVQAVEKSGEGIPVYVYLNDGTAIPVFAIFEKGNDHFMDVKGVHDGDKISIKLVYSDDVLIPVKGISSNGDILDVKALTADGDILDVKGVSRDGNTLNLAAVEESGRNIPLKAVSTNGVERDVKGVKLVGENIEMEFGDINIVGHVKALPTIDVGDVDRKWEVVAYTENNDKLKMVAINQKGREYPITAKMEGNNPYLMDVKAGSSVDIHIKLIKKDGGLILSGIDEYGRLYEVKGILEDGSSYAVMGGETTGNVTPIFVVGQHDEKFPLKAVSSKGHSFDVKGLKAKEDDVEGTISGLNVWIRYFAHVKALAPAEKE